MRRALILTVVLSGFVCGPLTTAARADLADSIAAELQAAGVPSVGVTVQTPAPASAADLASYDETPLENAPSVSAENLISPDPMNPLPVIRVQFGPNTVTPLGRFIEPPGLGLLPSHEDAASVTWRLEIMSALKHALADGAQLAGVAMQPTGAADPDMYLTPPDSDYAPPMRLDSTLSDAAIEDAVRAQLPPQARDAEIAVRDVGTERRISVVLPVRPEQFLVDNGNELVAYLLDRQLELNETGAGIGGVFVELTDPGTGEPLFTYGGDATWGQNFSWSSPLVAAWLGRVVTRRSDDLAGDVAGEAEEAVEGSTETLPPIGP